jgi:hypothetical protein
MSTSMFRAIAGAASAGSLGFAAFRHSNNNKNNKNNNAQFDVSHVDWSNHSSSFLPPVVSPVRSSALLAALSALVQSQTTNIAVCEPHPSASHPQIAPSTDEGDEVEERYRSSAPDDANEVIEDLLCQLESLEATVFDVRARYKERVVGECRAQHRRDESRYDQLHASISDCRTLSTEEREVLLKGVEKAREESRADLEAQCRRELIRRHDDFVLLEKDVSRAHKQYLLRVRSAELGMRESLAAYRHRLAKLAPEHYKYQGGSLPSSTEETISEAEDTIITFMSTEAGQ